MSSDMILVFASVPENNARGHWRQCTYHIAKTCDHGNLQISAGVHSVTLTVMAKFGGLWWTQQACDNLLFFLPEQYCYELSDNKNTGMSCLIKFQMVALSASPMAYILVATRLMLFSMHHNGTVSVTSIANGRNTAGLRRFVGQT
jgi:hypothetical protein